jgi:hypothetical protein
VFGRSSIEPVGNYVPLWHPEGIFMLIESCAFKLFSIYEVVYPPPQLFSINIAVVATKLCGSRCKIAEQFLVRQKKKKCRRMQYG